MGTGSAQRPGHRGRTYLGAWHARHRSLSTRRQSPGVAGEERSHVYNENNSRDVTHTRPRTGRQKLNVEEKLAFKSLWLWPQGPLDEKERRPGGSTPTPCAECGALEGTRHSRSRVTHGQTTQPKGSPGSREAPQPPPRAGGLGLGCLWGSPYKGAGGPNCNQHWGPGRGSAHRTVSLRLIHRRQALGVQGVPGGPAAPLRPSRGLPGRESQAPARGLPVGVDGHGSSGRDSEGFLATTQ